MCRNRLSLAGAGRVRRGCMSLLRLLAELARLPGLDHQGHVEVLAVQFHALRQPVAGLLAVAAVFDLPAVLLQMGEAAVAVEGHTALAVRRGQAADPPE